MSKNEEHLRELADALSVNLYLHRKPPRKACSIAGSCWNIDYYVDENLKAPWALIEGWHPLNTAAYVCGLHELGHHALEAMTSESTEALGLGNMTEGEAKIWEWALARSRRKPTAQLHELMANHWLSSYAETDGGGGPAYMRMATLFGLKSYEKEAA